MQKSFTVAALFAAFLLSGCAKGPQPATIAVPNDTTNEARALLLLQENGIITLAPGSGITATVRDIIENPHGVVIREVEAAQIPNIRKDVDFAVINSNFAISAGLNPVKDSLKIEGAFSAYANIVAVKEDRVNDPKTKALVAALESEAVQNFIKEKYDGAVVGTVSKATDGFDPDLDYAALEGSTISVAASPTPHAEILAKAVPILAQKKITLKVTEFSDYVQPNMVVNDGQFDANYFQHKPYLDDFNKEKGTRLASAAAIHVEPMGLYPGKQSSLDALKK